MKSLISRSWESSDKSLKIEFYLDCQAKDENIEVSYKIKRLDLANVPLDNDSMAFGLTEDPLIGYVGFASKKINYAFLDGYKIQGKLKVQEIINPGEARTIAVWTNLFYGFHEFKHLEGLIVHFDEIEELIIEIKECELIEETDFPVNILEEVADTEILKQKEFDLFPYVQVQFWPEPSYEDLYFNFIEYTNVNFLPSPKENLYEILSKLRSSSQKKIRESMITACLDYINKYGISDWHEVPFPFNLYPHIYDIFLEEEKCEKDILELLIEILEVDLEIFDILINQKEYSEFLQQLWQQYFASVVIQDYHQSLFKKLNKALLIANLIAKISLRSSPPTEMSNKDIVRLLRATIVLPESIYPLPAFEASKMTNSDLLELGSIQPFAIGYLQMVKQRIVGYELGEIARIENVASGEKKEIIQRKLKRKKEKERSEIKNYSDLNDSSIDQSHDFNSEINKTIGTLTQTENFDKLDIAYGPMIINGTSTLTTKQGNPDKDLLQRFAKKILNKTANRIGESVYKMRASKSLHELEDTVSSVFDNSTKSAPFVGVYRWVNKLYQARVVNYGNRLILEFIQSNPASNYKKQQQNFYGTNLVKPISLAKRNILSYLDIKASNYIKLYSIYGVTDITLKPDKKAVVSAILTTIDNQKMIKIPKDYVAKSASVQVIFSEESIKSINGIIGEQNFEINRKKKSPTSIVSKTIKLNKETGELPIVVDISAASDPIEKAEEINGFLLTARIECKLSSNALADWKLKVYKQIQAGYEKQKDAYYESLGSELNGREKKNPAMIRDVILTELKYNCKNLLIGKFYNKVGFLNEDNREHEIDINEPIYGQFFDRIFEWNEMSFTFRESYMSNQNMQGVFLQSNIDSLQAFLEAKTANVFLPVNPLFNLNALYYLTSGLKWDPSNTFVPVHSVNMQIAVALKGINQDQINGNDTDESWNVIVPTSMQMIQESKEFGLINSTNLALT